MRVRVTQIIGVVNAVLPAELRSLISKHQVNAVMAIVQDMQSLSHNRPLMRNTPDPYAFVEPLELRCRRPADVLGDLNEPFREIRVETPGRGVAGIGSEFGRSPRTDGR